MPRLSKVTSKMPKDTKHFITLTALTRCKYVSVILAVICSGAVALISYLGFAEKKEEPARTWISHLMHTASAFLGAPDTPTFTSRVSAWLHSTGEKSSHSLRQFMKSMETHASSTFAPSDIPVSVFPLQLLLPCVMAACGVLSIYYFKAQRRKTTPMQMQRLQELKLKSPVSVLNCSGLMHHQYVWCTRLTALVFSLILLALLISIPWEFIRLYQNAVSRKAAITIAGMPAECRPEHMSVWEMVTSWLRWHMSWMEDPCEKYHQAVLVDPLWEVTPMMVISSALARCIVHPLTTVLGGVGEAMRAFFAFIPSPWQPILMTAFIVLIMATLIMTCGYRISVPFFLRLEPVSQGHRNETMFPQLKNPAVRSRSKAQKPDEDLLEEVS